MKFADLPFYRVLLHLSDLNAKLEGFGKAPAVMFDNIRSFEMGLKMSKHDTGCGTFKYFPNQINTLLCLEVHDSDCKLCTP
jgi:hypothetical protein